MDDIVGIFPAPILIARAAATPAPAPALIARRDGAGARPDLRDPGPTHTPMDDPRARDATRDLPPRARAFGAALLGEDMSRAVEEIRVNRLETGGARKTHAHATGFASGAICPTGATEQAPAVLRRQVGATSFLTRNKTRRCAIGPSNTPAFRSPPMGPGDMTLFPGRPRRTAPPDRGASRDTAAFNAPSARRDSWGHVLRFR